MFSCKCLLFLISKPFPENSLTILFHLAILIIAHLPCVEGVPGDVLFGKASSAFSKERVYSQLKTFIFRPTILFEQNKKRRESSGSLRFESI